MNKKMRIKIFLAALILTSALTACSKEKKYDQMSEVEIESGLTQEEMEEYLRLKEKIEGQSVEDEMSKEEIDKILEAEEEIIAEEFPETVAPEGELELDENRVIEWFDDKLDLISKYNDNGQSKEAAMEFTALTQFIYHGVPAYIDNREVYYSNLSEKTQTDLEIKWYATSSKYYLSNYDNLQYVKEASPKVYDFIIKLGNTIEEKFNTLKDKATKHGFTVDALKEQIKKDFEKMKELKEKANDAGFTLDAIKEQAKEDLQTGKDLFDKFTSR
jgi:hypothetical protein